MIIFLMALFKIDLANTKLPPCISLKLSTYHEQLTLYSFKIKKIADRKIFFFFLFTFKARKFHIFFNSQAFIGLAISKFIRAF